MVAATAGRSHTTDRWCASAAFSNLAVLQRSQVLMSDSLVTSLNCTDSFFTVVSPAAHLTVLRSNFTKLYGKPSLWRIEAASVVLFDGVVFDALDVRAVIQTFSSEQVSVRNCLFQSFELEHSRYPLRIMATSISLERSRFIDVFCAYAPVWIDGNSTILTNSLRISECEFRFSTPERYLINYVIYAIISHTAVLRMSDCTFSNIYATSSMILLPHQRAWISNSSFENCISFSRATIFQGLRLRMDNCSVTNCASRASSFCAIHCQTIFDNAPTRLQISNSTFSGTLPPHNTTQHNATQHNAIEFIVYFAPVGYSCDRSGAEKCNVLHVEEFEELSIDNTSFHNSSEIMGVLYAAASRAPIQIRNVTVTYVVQFLHVRVDCYLLTCKCTAVHLPATITWILRRWYCSMRLQTLLPRALPRTRDARAPPCICSLPTSRTARSAISNAQMCLVVTYHLVPSSRQCVLFGI